MLFNAPGKREQRAGAGKTKNRAAISILAKNPGRAAIQHLPKRPMQMEMESAAPPYATAVLIKPWVKGLLLTTCASQGCCMPRRRSARTHAPKCGRFILPQHWRCRGL